jgi:5'-3' exonuclease
MGIPSYYRKLIHVVPGLVSSERHEVAWLFMDFNCLIYHCIPNVKSDNFEQGLIEEVVRYTKEVVAEIAPSQGVYIAIDGVVPMAKMRQQRLRRFKSVWEKARVNDSLELNPVKWDTNAITPGTVFMNKLAAALQFVCDEKGWTLSSAEQPFEAEQKLTVQWRTGNYSGLDIAVYGMDADLIVLSLLGQAQNDLGAIWLFREGDVGFEWFSIDLLKTWLTSGRFPNFILSYCFAMSVLGNDFLPSSLGLKMRDGGHDELLRYLINPLILDYAIIEENLLELFRDLSKFEPHRVAKYINTKQRMAQNATDLGLGENNWPLSQIEEGLIGSHWASAYWKLIDGSPVDICCEYLKGIRWIWDYYTTGSVCYNWFYPYVLPPLWATLALSGQIAILRTSIPPCIRAEEISTVEQLALVLPLQSWSLIPDCYEKRFPALAPQFFPSSFEFESIGKRFWWETIPCICLPTPSELKRIMQSLL